MTYFTHHKNCTYASFRKTVLKTSVLFTCYFHDVLNCFEARLQAWKTFCIGPWPQNLEATALERKEWDVATLTKRTLHFKKHRFIF